MGLIPSTAVNVLEMIGIGPFITIGVIIYAMDGPQAYLAGFSMMGLILAATLGIFTMSLGYSRILYAAGSRGKLV